MSTKDLKSFSIRVLFTFQIELLRVWNLRYKFHIKQFKFLFVGQFCTFFHNGNNRKYCKKGFDSITFCASIEISEFSTEHHSTLAFNLLSYMEIKLNSDSPLDLTI